LFVWATSLIGGRFEAVDTLIEVDDGVLTKGTDVFPPCDQVIDQFVDTGRGDVGTRFVFSNKLIEEVDIILIYLTTF